VSRGTSGRATESDETRRIAKVIRERRDGIFTLTDLAEALGRSKSYVAERDAGAAPWNVDELVVIARLIPDVTVGSLLAEAGVR